MSAKMRDLMALTYFLQSKKSAASPIFEVNGDEGISQPPANSGSNSQVRKNKEQEK